MTASYLSRFAGPLRPAPSPAACCWAPRATPRPPCWKPPWRAPQPAMVTASLRRQGSNPAESGASFWELLRKLGCAGAAQHRGLPQRAGGHHHRPDGARGVRHALDQAGTDRRRLHPAARHAEPGAGRPSTSSRTAFRCCPTAPKTWCCAKRLVDVGCQAVMPWAAPIGTGRGPSEPLRAANRCASG